MGKGVIVCKWDHEKGFGASQDVLHLPAWCDIHRQNRKVCIDKCISFAIRKLWEGGFETLNCCCGHGFKKLSGPSIVIPNSYNESQICEIRRLLRIWDSRDWIIHQWQIRKKRKHWFGGKRWRLKKV